jgi:hypothetical protein
MKLVLIIKEAATELVINLLFAAVMGSIILGWLNMMGQ